MKVYVRLLCILTFFVFSGVSYVSSQTPVSYESIVAASSVTAATPIGVGSHNLGPYYAHGKLWVFYSDGTNFVWKTKQIEEGGEWSNAQVLFPGIYEGWYVNAAFDGEHFHFVRAAQENLLYSRAFATESGGLIQDNAVVAWRKADWRPTGGQYSIEIDHRRNVWIAVQVRTDDGTQYEAYLLSSVATDGTWVDRPGFPQWLTIVPSTSNLHGWGASVVELEPGKIMATWYNNTNPFKIVARVWTEDANDPDGEGTYGDIENTNLDFHDLRTSAVVSQGGIPLVNSANAVARRNPNGQWNLVSPAGVVASDYNSLSVQDGAVRLWTRDGNNIRYVQTNNIGDSWSQVITKWVSDSPRNFSASYTRPRGGDLHSVLWVSGSSPPYSLVMGIDGFMAPQSPALVSPPDDEIEVPADVLLDWNSVAGVATYDLQLSKASDFSAIIIDTSAITNTQLSVRRLDINTVYYWRVRGVTPRGVKGSWSPVWSFTTTGLPPAPALLSPANGAIDLSTNPVLSWIEMPGVDGYWVQVSTDPEFSTTFLENENIVQSTYHINGLDHDRTYYWRVRGFTDSGAGEWSEVWSFTTVIAAPQPPVLVSPEDDAQNVLTALQVSWQESPTATSYRLQVSKQPNFSSTVVNVGNITGTTFDVSGLEHSTVYYWRVNATNESGTGGWSMVWSFTTIIAIPNAPVLLSPVIGAESVSTFPVLRWDVSARADTYRFQLSKNSQFSPLVLDRSDIDSTQYTFTEELDEFTRYYWRVNATNIGGTSEWSPVSHFTTDQAVPVAPVLVGPEDGTTNVTNAMMLWNSVPTATAYRLQVSKNADFSSPAVDRDDITNTFFQATNLEKWTKYYWRVRGVSRVGQGYWSNVRSFETGDIVSVEIIDSRIPDKFALGQNFPNPFNPVTSIQFALPTDAIVRLEVYNMLGQRIATLVDGEYHTAGTYQAMWDARDDAGREVSSGIYIYRISAGDFIETKKMTLMK